MCKSRARKCLSFYQDRTWKLRPVCVFWRDDDEARWRREEAVWRIPKRICYGVVSGDHRQLQIAAHTRCIASLRWQRGWAICVWLRSGCNTRTTYEYIKLHSDDDVLPFERANQPIASQSGQEGCVIPMEAAKKNSSTKISGLIWPQDEVCGDLRDVCNLLSTVRVSPYTMAGSWKWIIGTA